MATEFRFDMAKPHADALGQLRKVWRIKRFTMQCKFCYRQLPLVDDGKVLPHMPGCRAFSEQHPWAQLRAILNGNVS